jgi:hypothetical protein
MTLTKRLPDNERQKFMKAAQVHFASILGQPLEVDALTVFAETRPERNFVVEERFPLLHSVSVRIAS